MYHTMVHTASSVRIDGARPTGKSVVTAAAVLLPMEQGPRRAVPPFTAHKNRCAEKLISSAKSI